MSESDDSSRSIDRRTLLGAIATGLDGVGGARTARAAGTQSPRYVVEQGDRCFPITPLVGNQTAASFYDYRTPETSPAGTDYSSYGTTRFQRQRTSIMFLYEEPNGVNLVLVHDKLNGGQVGGAVSFDLTFAHPGRGSWLIADDDYGGAHNFDSFARRAEGWHVDWTWGSGRSDGGVYGPLGEEFAVTIDPAFNEQAALYGDHFDGILTDWQVLTGDRSDPRHVSLAMDRLLTIRTGSCNESRATSRDGERDRQRDHPSAQSVPADVVVAPGEVAAADRDRHRPGHRPRTTDRPPGTITLSTLPGVVGRYRPTALAEALAFILTRALGSAMPATLEVKCTDDDCEMDMFEMHYTYDMPDDVGVSDFQCPYCGGTDCLREIEL